MDVVAQAEQRELERREQQYRRGHPALDLRGETVILVDDALATRSPMQAAALAARQMSAARVVVAAPVGARDLCHALAEVAAEVICAPQSARVVALGQWHHNLSDVSDGEGEERVSRARQVLAAMQP